MSYMLHLNALAPRYIGSHTVKPFEPVVHVAPTSKLCLAMPRYASSLDKMNVHVE